ncbi:hypothetical protein JL720_15104 [Aureococcus anophagefferens]|nr:hypothetical protein JL720_15104 [Aureococcus anophagefferens]
MESTFKRGRGSMKAFYEESHQELVDLEKGIESEARHLRHRVDWVWYHPRQIRRLLEYWLESSATGPMKAKFGLFVVSGGLIITVLSELWLLMAREGASTKLASYFLRAFGAIVAIVGVIYLSVLMGFLVEAISAMMNRATRGLSPLVEDDHLIVIGFTHKCLEVLEQLALALESDGGGLIVVLAGEDDDSDDVHRVIRDTIPEKALRGSKIAVRRGNPQSLADLQRVSVQDAKAVIILSPTGTSADRADCSVLRTVLALTALRGDADHTTHIIAELQDIDNRHIVQVTGGPAVECVVSHDICSRLLLTTSRHPGLGLVYDHIFGFEGSEFYLKEWPQLVGRTFGEIYASFPTAVPIGLKVADRRVARMTLVEEFHFFHVDVRCPMLKPHGIMLNPPRDFRVSEGDEVIVLAADDDTYAPALGSAEPAEPQGFQFAGEESKKSMRERVLLCNWRRDVDDMLLMLDEAVKDGSEVHIMSDISLEERRDVFHVEGFDEDKLRSITLHHHVGRTTVKRDLEVVPLREMDSVLILADERHEASPLESDAQNLATLLLIRDIRQSCKERDDAAVVSPATPATPSRPGTLARQESMQIRQEKQAVRANFTLAQRKSLSERKLLSIEDDGSRRSLDDVDDCSIICEILDSRTSAVARVNSSIAAQAEYVLSHGICAKILAMVAMRRELDGVTGDPGRTSFAALARVAMDKHVLLLGYQKIVEGQLILNPQKKDVESLWSKHDLLVGLMDTTKKDTRAGHAGEVIREASWRRIRKESMRQARVAGDVVLATTKSPKNATFGAPRRLPSLRRTSAPVSPGADVVHEEKEEEHRDDA